MLSSKNIQSWPWQSNPWLSWILHSKWLGEGAVGILKIPDFLMTCISKEITVWRLWDQRPCWARTLPSSLGDVRFLCSGFISEDLCPFVYGFSLALHGMEQNQSFSEMAAIGINNVTSYLHDNPLAWHGFLLLHIPTYIHKDIYSLCPIPRLPGIAAEARSTGLCPQRAGQISRAPHWEQKQDVGMISWLSSLTCLFEAIQFYLNLEQQQQN